MAKLSHVSGRVKLKRQSCGRDGKQSKPFLRVLCFLLFKKSPDSKATPPDVWPGAAGVSLA